MQEKKNIEIYKYRDYQNDIEIGLPYETNSKFYR